MAIVPFSVQLTDKITTEPRKRNSNTTKEIRNAAHIISELGKAAAMQAKMGLGNPRLAVESKKTEFAKLAGLAQAEKLADKFKPVKEPKELFFPRFTVRVGSSVANGIGKGRLPELIMAQLGPGVERVHIDMQGPLLTGGQRSYEAPIPVIPPTVLELAGRAKECAPDAEFHILFMPSWEPAPQRDPVLLAHIPNSDEWFEIGAWDGDSDLIKEFLEDR